MRRSLTVRAALAVPAAAALLAGEAAAAAVPASCLTEAEVRGMAAFALPSMLQGAITRCGERLAPDGFFATQGAALVDRYAAQREAAWPAAKSGFLKFGAAKGDKTMEKISKLPDNALQPFVEGMVEQLVSGEIKPKQCADIEHATRLLAPLPPGNTAELVGFIVSLVDTDKKGGEDPGKFTLCKANA